MRRRIAEFEFAWSGLAHDRDRIGTYGSKGCRVDDVQKIGDRRPIGQLVLDRPARHVFKQNQETLAELNNKAVSGAWRIESVRIDLLGLDDDGLRLAPVLVGEFSGAQQGAQQALDLVRMALYPLRIAGQAEVQYEAAINAKFDALFTQRLLRASQPGFPA